MRTEHLCPSGKQNYHTRDRKNKTFSQGAALGLAQLSLGKAFLEGTQLTEGEDSLNRFIPSKNLERAAPATAFWAAMLTAGQVGALGLESEVGFKRRV